MTPLLQILALMREGNWDEAHNLVQLDDSSSAAWLRVIGVRPRLFDLTPIVPRLFVTPIVPIVRLLPLTHRVRQQKP